MICSAGHVSSALSTATGLEHSLMLDVAYELLSIFDRPSSGCRGTG